MCNRNWAALREGYTDSWVSTVYQLNVAYADADGNLTPEAIMQIPKTRLYLTGIYWALTTVCVKHNDILLYI